MALQRMRRAGGTCWHGGFTSRKLVTHPTHNNSHSLKYENVSQGSRGPRESQRFGAPTLSRALLAIVSALSITSVHVLGARPSAVRTFGARSSGLSSAARWGSQRGLDSPAGAALRGRATLRMADSPMSDEPRVSELLGRAQRAALSEIQLELGLEAGEIRTHSLGDKVDGSVQSFEGGRVAWASALHVPLAGGDYSANWLTVWNGPLLGVPHYQLRMDVIEGHIELLVNFSPRESNLTTEGVRVQRGI
ncbi:hypothetical protein T492DRAFT_845255 [Pavlovales sp. CCMP2436]|nr:hypothetical protein T492DRAFT_845255 [Pavlovales sp. CCMP2436]